MKSLKLKSSNWKVLREQADEKHSVRLLVIIHSFLHIADFCFGENKDQFFVVSSYKLGPCNSITHSLAHTCRCL